VFSKNIRIIYLYLVAIAALGMIMGGTFAIISNVTNFLLPERVVNIQYKDNIVETKEYNSSIYIDATNQEQTVRNIKNLIYSLVVLGVGIPVFMIDWKAINKERNEKEEK
jgi:predicted methyltransferase